MTRDEALQVLGLKPGASCEEVRIAHRELAQMLHPDKFDDNKRLRERAERQMRSINEARDVLLKGRERPGGARRGPSGASKSPERIAFEAEARAHAAETARLTVVAQARTLRERRGGMVTLTIGAAVVMLFTMRLRGTLGSIIGSVAMMLVVWGIVDLVTLSNQAHVLDRRARELLRQRDAASDVARRAREL